MKTIREEIEEKIEKILNDESWENGVTKTLQGEEIKRWHIPDCNFENVSIDITDQILQLLRGRLPKARECYYKRERQIFNCKDCMFIHKCEHGGYEEAIKEIEEMLR